VFRHAVQAWLIALGAHSASSGLPADVRSSNCTKSASMPSKLLAEHLGNRHRQFGAAAVMAVGQHLCQLVRARARELQRLRCQAARELKVSAQVSVPRAYLARHDARRFAPVRHSLVGAKCIDIAQEKTVPDSVHPVHEIVDHPVCFGMARIEAVQLSVGHYVDSRQFLRLQHTRIASRNVVFDVSPRSQVRNRVSCPPPFV